MGTSGFENWKQSDVENHNRRIREDMMKKRGLIPIPQNGGGEDDAEHDHIAGITAPAKKRIRQDPKPLLNKLETEFFGKLKSEFPGHPIKAQAVRLRIGNGVTLTLDFMIFHPDRTPSAWEVKGPFAWEDSIVKLKIAASVFPEISFFLVWKENNLWERQKIIP
jgi:hypothetical protein